jgi:hypothetical protein
MFDQVLVELLRRLKLAHSEALADPAAEAQRLPVAAMKVLACTIAGRNLSDAEVRQYFGRELQRGPTCPAS